MNFAVYKDQKNAPLVIYVADTIEAQVQGLQGVLKLPYNSGMLFVYPEPTYASFWMYNTFIDLDIAFIDDNYNVLSIKKLDSHDTRHVGCDDIPYRYALEMNRGWFQDNDITVGSNVADLLTSDKLVAITP